MSTIFEPMNNNILTMNNNNNNNYNNNYNVFEDYHDYDYYDDVEDYDFTLNQNVGGSGGSKGRNGKKKGGNGKGVYNQKHIRVQTAIQEKSKVKKKRKS